MRLMIMIIRGQSRETRFTANKSRVAVVPDDKLCVFQHIQRRCFDLFAPNGSAENPVICAARVRSRGAFAGAFSPRQEFGVASKHKEQRRKESRERRSRDFQQSRSRHTVPIGLESHRPAITVSRRRPGSVSLLLENFHFQPPPPLPSQPLPQPTLERPGFADVYATKTILHPIRRDIRTVLFSRTA